MTKGVHVLQKQSCYAKLSIWLLQLCDYRYECMKVSEQQWVCMHVYTLKNNLVLKK